MREQSWGHKQRILWTSAVGAAGCDDEEVGEEEAEEGAGVEEDEEEEEEDEVGDEVEREVAASAGSELLSVAARPHKISVNVR